SDTCSWVSGIRVQRFTSEGLSLISNHFSDWIFLIQVSLVKMPPFEMFHEL
ncbi:hypothetical protein EMPG_10182, partial [Blastomyces silverae]